MLEEVARAWTEALGWKTKHAFMLLRLAVTGRKASPPLFDTMAVLGKEITRRRLRNAAAGARARRSDAALGSLGASSRSPRSPLGRRC